MTADIYISIASVLSVSKAQTHLVKLHFSMPSSNMHLLTYTWSQCAFVATLSIQIMLSLMRGCLIREAGVIFACSSVGHAISHLHLAQ